MAGEVKGPNPALVAARAAALALHSPTHFLRELPLPPQQERYGTGAALRFGAGPGEEVLAMTATAGQWLLHHLPWDTEFFGTDTYRLFTGLFGAETERAVLHREAESLRADLARRGPYYAFAVVPAEDLALLQALSGGGWRLIETRLTFYRSTAESVPGPPAPVRRARPDEAARLGRVAAAARNPYDRFHADPWFGEARADALLARYAEAAVVGTYADAVLVPATGNGPVDAFLAIGDVAPLPDAPGSGTSRVLLTAVGPGHRGWHVKLVAETVRRAAALTLPHVLMTTQATNHAVFRTCEKLGFRLGSVAHVLACHSA